MRGFRRISSLGELLDMSGIAGVGANREARTEILTAERMTTSCQGAFDEAGAGLDRQ